MFVCGSVIIITWNSCIDPHQTGFEGKGSDHLQLIKFWPSHTLMKGVCSGAKFLAPSYYSQRAVFASPPRAFFSLAKQTSEANYCGLNCRHCWENIGQIAVHSFYIIYIYHQAQTFSIEKLHAVSLAVVNPSWFVAVSIQMSTINSSDITNQLAWCQVKSVNKKRRSKLQPKQNLWQLNWKIVFSNFSASCKIFQQFL